MSSAGSRRQTRYRIGPGGVAYTVITVGVGAAAWYTQANLLFWALGLLIGGLVVSILAASQALRAIDAQRLVPPHGVAGEALVLRYQLHNRSRLPVFGLQLAETWGPGLHGWQHTGPVAQKPAVMRASPRGWVLHLGPRQTSQGEAYCWPLIRGPLRFEQIVLSTTFPFGVIRKSVTVHQTQDVLVYPHLYRITRRQATAMLPNHQPEGHAGDRSGGQDEFYGLREYRPGDSIRLISWKHSARSGKQVAREMTWPHPPRTMILLDLTPPPPGSCPHAPGSCPHASGRFFNSPARFPPRDRFG